MLNTSLDLLYIIIAFCILWLTIFICWWLFYVIMIIRRVYQIVKSIKEKLKLIDEMTHTAKDKLNNAAVYIDLAAEGIGKIVGMIKNKKQQAQTPPPQPEPKKRRGKTVWLECHTE